MGSRAFLKTLVTGIHFLPRKGLGNIHRKLRARVRGLLGTQSPGQESLKSAPYFFPDVAGFIPRDSDLPNFQLGWLIPLHRAQGHLLLKGHLGPPLPHTPSGWCLYSFPRAAVPSDHKQNGLKQQEFILFCTGSQKSEIKLLAAPRFL